MRDPLEQCSSGLRANLGATRDPDIFAELCFGPP
jgi:hypothetical protein